MNTMLMTTCGNYGLGYTNDNNVQADFLAQHGLHLNKLSKSSLAINFINFINRYTL